MSKPGPPHSRYALDAKPVASGSQGSVYFATRADGLAVAVKVAASGRPAADALRHEIDLLRAIHAHGVGGVVTCLDAIEVDGRPALVMPRYPRHLGAWLHEVIRQPGPDTLADILAKCAELAYVLGRVHETPYRGGTLVHRDIKPENIFLDEHDRPYVGDFGGAMAIGDLRAVELALFGTPMWAPLDQILPGRAIPDPTWDTYALCVLLYAALTGARPAYQSDPRTLLTNAGVALWNAAKKAIESPPTDRATWHRRFSEMRRGTRASDLIDPVGHAALVDGDREVLQIGVARLCDLAGAPIEVQAPLMRGLWNLLGRGLSPLSHPSPPNRFRSGLELGEQLDDLRALIAPRSHPPGPGAPTTPAGADPRQGPLIPSLAPQRLVRAGAPWLVIAALLGAGGLSCAGLVAFREPLTEAGATLLQQVLPRPATVPVGAPVAFRIDTTEVTAGRFRRCVADGACPAIYQRLQDEWPAIALDLEAARAVCRWAGGRLPTEAEWVRAAGDGPMPWGDAAATCDRALAAGCSDDLAPVGSAPRGASPWGALDMAGSVWEWTEDGALMGGALTSGASELGIAGRLVLPDGDAHPLAGARCAYDP